MKHNFTDEQLSDAYQTALGQGSPGDTVADYIRATLDNLPDPEPELEATGQPHDFWTINSAIVKASEEYPQLRGLEVVPVAAILSYLPDPEPVSDEWQQHDVRSVRKGDRVRWTVPGSEDNESYEIVVAAVTNDDGVVLDSESHSYYFPYGSVVDRIPAPVQHPDPEDHPVIIIYRPNGNGKSPVSYAWTGKHYRSFDGQEYFSVREITDWSPAKVVAADG
jgi:hypothetical protein